MREVLVYRIPDQPGCLCPPLLESMPYLTAVSEVGKAGQHALAGGCSDSVDAAERSRFEESVSFRKDKLLLA